LGLPPGGENLFWKGARIPSGPAPARAFKPVGSKRTGPPLVYIERKKKRRCKKQRNPDIGLYSPPGQGLSIREHGFRKKNGDSAYNTFIAAWRGFAEWKREQSKISRRKKRRACGRRSAFGCVPGPKGTTRGGIASTIFLFTEAPTYGKT